MKKVQGFQRRTPRQARSQATVVSILEAAAQVLQRADRFNTNAVAERAGVSIGTLYQYFKDKDAILVALAHREMAKPEMRPQLSLVAALVRALEKLLGAGRKAGAVRTRRAMAAMRSKVDRVLFHADDVLLSWIVLPMPMPPVKVRRRA